MTRNSRNNVPAETEKVLFDGGYSYDASIPVLSVVIPVYQVDKYLPRCLESVTEQTFQNLEIIVVEDCSGQKDRAIIESFCRRDPRIRYIRHSRNMGLFQARITGMKYASGEYFAFLDGDDSLSVDYYRLLMDRIRESAAFIQGCGLPYEFRTTVVRELHRAEDFLSIGRWLQGAEAYFLQSYQESEGVISPVFSAYSKEELEAFQSLLLPFIPNTRLRGVD